MNVLWLRGNAGSSTVPAPCPAWPNLQKEATSRLSRAEIMKGAPGRPAPRDIRGGRIWTDDPQADTNDHHQVGRVSVFR